jgi:hypothetical protein
MKAERRLEGEREKKILNSRDCRDVNSNDPSFKEAGTGYMTWSIHSGTLSNLQIN